MENIYDLDPCSEFPTFKLKSDRSLSSNIIPKERQASRSTLATKSSIDSQYSNISIQISNIKTTNYLSRIFKKNNQQKFKAKDSGQKNKLNTVSVIRTITSGSGVSN